MSLNLQDVIVTLLALGAAWIVLRRVFGVFRPAARPQCSNCASGAAACAPAEGAEGLEPDGKPVPMVLHRR